MRFATSESDWSDIGVIVARLGRPGPGSSAGAYPPLMESQDDPEHQDDPERTRPASQPIHRVAALRDVRIRVSDGLELSANLWLPEPLADGTGPQAFPAILEMIPYRKDDWRAASDQSRGEWLAARG